MTNRVVLHGVLSPLCGILRIVIQKYFYPQPDCPNFKNVVKKFGNKKLIPIFAVPNAEIAQLVEHDLAKVGVASSSLVFRSKGQFSTDLFLCPDHCAFPRTRGPVLPPLEGRGGYKKARIHVADVGSSLVFRSRFSLASVGLFSYISVCYATLTWLWRICGLVRNFSERRRISGKMWLISGECFTLCLTLETISVEFKLFLICLFLIDCRLHCVFVAVCGVLHCLPCLCAGLALSIVKRVERNVCFHVEYIVNSFSIISCISHYLCSYTYVIFSQFFLFIYPL